MSTRFAVVVVTLTSMVASRAVGEAPGSSFAAPPLRTVALVWMDPAAVASGLELVARHEARSLLARMGASVSWQREEGGGSARTGQVRVILLDRAAARGPGTPILGATPPRFEVSPFVWVHVPNVRAALGLPPRGGTTSLEPPMLRALGIALGRVIAHEVVHALAPSVPHGKGLMSASLSRPQLTSASIAIEEGAVLGVQAALRGDPFLPRSGPGVMAAAVRDDERRR